MHEDAAPLDCLLRLPRVVELTGLSRSMIYRLISEGQFPAPYKPAKNASRWAEQEIREWRERLDNERRERLGLP